VVRFKLWLVDSGLSPFWLKDVLLLGGYEDRSRFKVLRSKVIGREVLLVTGFLDGRDKLILVIMLILPVR
jgi:hypothetical protein